MNDEPRRGRVEPQIGHHHAPVLLADQDAQLADVALPRGPAGVGELRPGAGELRARRPHSDAVVGAQVAEAPAAGTAVLPVGQHHGVVDVEVAQLVEVFGAQGVVEDVPAVDRLVAGGDHHRGDGHGEQQHRCPGRHQARPKRRQQEARADLGQPGREEQRRRHDHRGHVEGQQQHRRGEAPQRGQAERVVRRRQGQAHRQQRAQQPPARVRKPAQPHRRAQARAEQGRLGHGVRWPQLDDGGPLLQGEGSLRRDGWRCHRLRPRPWRSPAPASCSL